MTSENISLLYVTDTSLINTELLTVSLELTWSIFIAQFLIHRLNNLINYIFAFALIKAKLKTTSIMNPRNYNSQK